MKNLKVLQISFKFDIWKRAPIVCVDLGTMEWHGDASNFVLSNKLCIMEWWGYPCESLPTHFQSDNLVELIVRYSCIKQLWVGRNVRFWLMHIEFILMILSPFTLVHFI